jgi:hypothetical protein
LRGLFVGHGEKKTRRLDQFIAAMMSHGTLEAAAAAAEIAASTARRWMKDPDVIRRFAEARRDAMNRAILRLQEAASGAVDGLCQVQKEGESESARVSAARCILEQALRLSSATSKNGLTSWKRSPRAAVGE